MCITPKHKMPSEGNILHNMHIVQLFNLGASTQSVPTQHAPVQKHPGPSNREGTGML